MVRYHDREWGVPSFDDRHLFEMLTLEGAQAGLAWSTILSKRARYREVFAGFDPAAVARFTPARQARLLRDPGIVRNRAKVASAVGNAQAFLALAREEGSFARWLWRFVDFAPVQGRWRDACQVPAETDLSRRISRELRRRGFRFVGPTIVQAFLQATGVANDHELGCFRHAEVARRRVPRSLAGRGVRGGERSPARGEARNRRAADPASGW